MTHHLSLAFGLSFTDLYTREGLIQLDQAFQHHLNGTDPVLCCTYLAARTAGQGGSDLLIQLAPHVEDFIGHLFTITPDIHGLQTKHHGLAAVLTIKRQFVQRFASRKYTPDVAETFNGDQLRQDLSSLIGHAVNQLTLAHAVTAWLKDEAQNVEALDIAARYCAWAVHTVAGHHYHREDVLFKLPQKIDWARLVDLERDNGFIIGKPDHQRRRDGFKLTDPGFDRLQALDQANYCIWCHHQGKDSCSKGLKPKGERADKFQKSPLGTLLNGCPLEEKISEMNEVKSQGYTVGALAIVTIDNPMAAATGHRICNDCMKSCIYQKQEPVNIPAVETQVLRDVLNLPWGFEIYSLFTRWNPLNFARPLPREDSHKSVLVVGMGPAGFTLAHHLMNDGHQIVAIDGLKIEPLPDNLLTQPIHTIDTIMDPLDNRITGGFGGVAEYGITVRWDKNFLKIIRLLLERRQQFALFGGIRFGGTLTLDQALDLGFDHIALCMGAGSPTLIPMRNSLAAGVRQASDFLMALQLTGAAKADSVANLQVRLPAVVIGGGLTAIDTATEVMAYYPVQVEKFTKRFQELQKQTSEDLLSHWPSTDHETVQEFLSHGLAIINERARAEAAREIPNFAPLVQKWGGVTVAYRRDLTEAPSYTLNHEEVAKALEEGIRILDHASPVGVNVDATNTAISIELSVKGEPKTLPARTILVAAGTKPNINLTYDEPNRFKLEGKTFQAIDLNGHPVTPERLCKPNTAHVLMTEARPGQYLSFFGDMHPSYAGNVVKAMASAKQGYPVISTVLKQSHKAVSQTSLSNTLKESILATVEAVNRLTPTIVEVVVKAPLQAQNFRPGQFYRLQNFESMAPHCQGTRFAMEGLALTGASVDLENGLLSTIVLEMGGSSNLCRLLTPGEPVVLMGPTGEPTHIPEKETVLLVGGGLGNAVLFSIGQAMRSKGCRVLYFAGYKKLEDRFKVEEIKKAADLVVWCCDETPGFTPTRPHDKTFTGNIVQAITAYGQGDMGPSKISLSEVDRIIAIGSDRMMAAVAAARHGQLQPFLKGEHLAIGSINSPMQCMMKEICAQCLQRHIDPVTGQETIVYSCRNQDQNLDAVDFTNLNTRLKQNAVQEKMTALWIKHTLQ
ncbi:FAD-dependent oxidoreductase [Candidatus Odyssella acanthamoebae]|uniref:Pyridine nucleotide-disulfide oxidoreductase n=1 Tax=Candidatus Odyssella acanthamoebae TaxID=91604 RepID=A0A077AYD5_9PROT|nr:FAD-dependent oxidoreductase [Candidatus Paracaedibacter acanthamoebae]AIK96994.1 pyridine nucleotide-disulfide oxidoreductase [Candidatus Paracaedibacter acanthamoebae]